MLSILPNIMLPLSVKNRDVKMYQMISAYFSGNPYNYGHVLSLEVIKLWCSAPAR